EPFMHPNLMELVRQVKRLDLICAITTNFTLVTEDRARELAELGLDEFTVSLWAASPETYSRTHPNKTEGSFKRIAKVLSLYNSLKPKGAQTILAEVIFAMNWHEIELMLDFALDTGCDGIYFTVIDSVSPRTDGLLLTEDQAKKALELAYRVKERVDALPKERGFILDNFHGFVRRLKSEGVTTGDYDRNAVDKIPCYVGWMFIRVLPNGDISPCCRGVRKPMGNLLKQSFEEIWNSERYMEFREKALKLPKSDPYFAPIGCHRTCDNLMHNEMMHERIRSLSEDEIESLRREIVNKAG
ncbi:MAG TPA: radical SAM protein, partial [Proteobacteria bacterium]|nr:radical SAM protein [Pseudomonadota bacterium]